MDRANKDFFKRDVIDVAKDLIGQHICISLNNKIEKLQITELEIYRGIEDKACHASKGRTPRTDIMFQQGGFVYVYLIYGMYWLLNFVCGEEGLPQAVLIRGVKDINGPGRLGKHLGLDKSFYGLDLVSSDKLWVEINQKKYKYSASPRIGINYAGEPWVSKEWRYVLSNE